MNREYHKWHSPRLGRDMELLVFGHGGLPVVVFPTSGGRFFEFEDRGLVSALWGKIDAGQLQLYCVDSVDRESWYNQNVPPRWRNARQVQYDGYLIHKVVPLVRLKNHPVGMWLRRSTVLAGFLLVAFGIVFTVRTIRGL